MILASYENVANSLMSLAYCVAVYEGVQERLYEEIKENEENVCSSVFQGSVCARGLRLVSIRHKAKTSFFLYLVLHAARSAHKNK